MYLLERLVLQARVPGNRRDGVAALTINTIFLQFAAGMVGMFGVLFVYQLGTSILQGLLYVLVFFGLQRLFVGLFIPYVGDLISKVGYRRVMFVGIFALALKLYFFTLVDIDTIWPLFPSFILGAINIPAYYLAYHALFLDDNDDDRVGEQIGFITMIGNFSQIASPLAAGVLVDAFGFSVMFTVSMVLLIFSVFPLLSMQKHKRHKDLYSDKSVFAFINNKKEMSHSMIFWYLTAGIQAFFWPIYLFKVVGSYTSFGMIGSMAMVANSVALYLTGRAYDKKPLNKMFWGSTVLVSATWIARFISITPFTAGFSDIVNRLFSPFWWMKIRRNELLEGEKIDSLVFGAAHEYLATLGYLLALPLGFFVLKMTNFVWPWLIVPTVMGTFIASYLVKDI